MKKLIFVYVYLLLAVPCGARTITVDNNNLVSAWDDNFCGKKNSYMI